MKNHFTSLTLFLSFCIHGQLSAQCTNPATYNVPGVVYDCTAPGGANTLTITAVGADGGDRTASPAHNGGAGGSVTASFSITPGDNIRIFVGGAGTDGVNSGGSGGGTAVVNCGNPADCANGTLLVVAGGAGGGAGGITGAPGLGGTNVAGTGNGGLQCSTTGGGGGINGAGGGARGGAQANKASLSAGGSAGGNGGAGGSGFGGGSGGNGVHAGGGGGYTGGTSSSATGFCIGAGGSNFVGAGATSVTNLTGATGGSGGNNTAGSVTLSFTVVLPVEWVRFNARSSKNVVQLDWQTASEQNNDGFAVQRSPDGQKWEDVTFIAGHGTTSEPHFYAYTDERPLPGINYYRIQQIDFDGRFEYSPILSVDMQDDGGFSLFPNPATPGGVTLQLRTDGAGDVMFTLYSLTGNQVKQIDLSLDEGARQVSLDLSDTPAGTYLATLSAKGKQWQQRLIIK